MYSFDPKHALILIEFPRSKRVGLTALVVLGIKTAFSKQKLKAYLHEFFA